MPLDYIKIVAEQASFALAAVVVALAIYSQRNRIGKAVEARVLHNKAAREGNALERYNGKLVEAISKAIEPLLELAVDRRFREMPEFMRDKIKALGEHGANNALTVYELKIAPRIAETTTRLDGINERMDGADERQNRMEGLLNQAITTLARVEGRLERGSPRR